MADRPADKGHEKSRTQGPARCPICGQPSEERYRPFCSRRCADVDLSRWLRGAYAIPDRPEDEDDAERAPEERPDAAGPSDPTRKS
jgi:endogenous inhibitor of DNA gyrase (YacG/DUF329 family)